MSDNVIKSTDVTSAIEEKNVVKKAPVKKAAAKIKVEKKKEGVENGKTVIIFDSGFSYSSGDIQFTREDCIQEVSEDVANFLLTLDNFRLPNTVELDDYLNSKED